MLLTISITALVVQALVALVVLLKDRKESSHIYFSLLSFALLFWALSSFMFEAYESAQTIATVRLTMFFVVLQNTFFAFFSYSLAKTSVSKRKRNSYIIFSVITALVALSPILFTGLEEGQNGTYPVAGPGMLFFIIHALASIIYGFRCMVSALHDANDHEKKQLEVIVAGSVILWGVVPATNFIYSITLQTTFFGLFSPLYGLAFSSLIAYAIVKHRLFDIRAVATRAVGYVIITGVVAVTYVVLANLLQAIVFEDTEISTGFLLFNITLTVTLIILYPYLKRVIDHLSNSIFYRDNYDTQSFIDELNQALVTDVEVESLLKKTAKIIETNLKASYCGFYIRETAYFPSRFVSTQSKKLPTADLERIRQVSPEISQLVYTLDSKPLNNEEKILEEVMKKNDIEIIGRLVSTLKYEVAGVGFLVVGPKKSGSSYTDQDIKVVEIISNELVLAVENALRLEEIEKFNVTLQKKIDEATKELKESNDKLKALDEAKDEFVSMASHQLRTPLTSIKGYISMVLEEDAGKINETQKKMLGQAFFSSQRMVYLISDLLNVSRLKTGKFIIETRPINLADLVESELNQLQEGAVAKSQTLSFTKPKDFPMLHLDDMKIRQVVMNFTDNAMYYTPVGGKITIELKDKKGSVEFTVKDSGIGVPKKEQPKLFTKFYRAENARKARPDGTGLGLFMAKKVVVAQGGAIIFSSKEGKGSTFGFSFPKERLLVKNEPSSNGKS